MCGLLQVRKDLQVLSARKDRLWRAARDLQKEYEDLETEQETMQRRMNRILQRVKCLDQLRSGGRVPTDFGSMKVTKNLELRTMTFLNHELHLTQLIKLKQTKPSSNLLEAQWCVHILLSISLILFPMTFDIASCVGSIHQWTQERKPYL